MLRCSSLITVRLRFLNGHLFTQIKKSFAIRQLLRRAVVSTATLSGERVPEAEHGGLAGHRAVRLHRRDFKVLHEVASGKREGGLHQLGGVGPRRLQYAHATTVKTPNKSQNPKKKTKPYAKHR